MQGYSLFLEKNGLVVNIPVNVPVSRLQRGRQKEPSGCTVTSRLVAVASGQCSLRSPRTVQVSKTVAKCSKLLCKQEQCCSVQGLRDGKE